MKHFIPDDPDDYAEYMIAEHLPMDDGEPHPDTQIFYHDGVDELTDVNGQQIDTAGWFWHLWILGDSRPLHGPFPNKADARQDAIDVYEGSRP